jgi:hypothetical protein
MSYTPKHAAPTPRPVLRLIPGGCETTPSRLNHLKLIPGGKA